MLSRVADSVFWMARYVERAENVARFIDVNHNLTLDLGEELGDQWAPLVYTTGDHEAFFQPLRAATRENVLHFLTFDTENPNSILSCLSHARENARTAREIISSDMWEELNRFYLLVRDAVRAGAQSDYDFFAQIKRASHLLIGTTDATMSHGEAWHFARMGRLLGAGRQDLAHSRRQVLHPAAASRRCRHDARCDAVVGPAALDQRPGDVSPLARPHRAAQGDRLSAARSAVSRARCAIASAGPKIRCTRSPARPTACSATGPSRSWAACARSSTSPRSTTSSAPACTSSSTTCSSA